MSFPLSYCPDGDARIARLSSLYERRAQHCIFACMGVPSRALDEFAGTHAAGYSPRPSPAERAAFWDEYLREQSAVHDDSIPCAYLSEMDQGLYGGMVGGRVQYMAHPENGWISSMVPPILKHWGEFQNLRISRDNEPFRYYLAMLETLGASAQGRFGLSHFILIDGLNFVFELVGATASYLAVEDDPGRVREAIDFAYRLNVEVQQVFFERVRLLEGGTCSNMAGWLPGRVVSESVDPFHMTSVGYFERWGREPAESIMGAFDGGVIHIHGNGRHLLPAVATMRGLRGICLLNDKGWPPAIDEAPRLQQLTDDMPLIVDTEFAAFTRAFERHAFAGGTLYKVHGVPDAGTANRLMDKVRAYRI